MTSPVQIDGESLSLESLYRVVFEDVATEIPAAARGRMNASRAVIERLVESGAAVYGVNTGFGKMASTRMSHGTATLAGEFDPQPLLRRRHDTQRKCCAGHAGAARQCAGQGIFGCAPCYR